LTPLARHNALVTSIRLALGGEPDFVSWLNTVKKVQTPFGYQSFGLCIGSSDIVGILAPAGRWICFEVKTGRGWLKEDQQKFRDLVRRMGGFACECRSIEDAKAGLERARRGANE
jgi:hypothetical protein